MIPKVAHFYWHGDEPLPELRRLSVESFSRMNPDWQHFVHHAGESSDPLWKKITQSDAARYGILYRAGGVYFDTDIIFVKPIPETWLVPDLLLPCTPAGGLYGVHVLGAPEGSPFFQDAMAKVKARMASTRVLGCQSLGVKLWEGVNIFQAVGNLSITPIPLKAFLLSGWSDVEDLWSKGGVPETAIGLHWYGGDPLSRHYEDCGLSDLPDCMVRSALEIAFRSQEPPSERTLARKGTAEVESWVFRETGGYASALDFGSGLGAYTRVMDCPVKDGIEAFEPYVITSNRDPDNNGSRFYLGDMRRFEDVVARDYDVALFVDTIEHLELDDALDLLKRCQTRFKKIVILVPIGPHDQEPCDDNEMQRHLSTWYGQELEDLGFVVKINPNFHTGNPEGKRAAAECTWVKQ